MRSGTFAATELPRVQSMAANYHAIFIAVMMIAFFAAVDVAHAFTRNVTFCNHTKRPMELAWGYDAVGTAETTSAGWQKVAACACGKLFSADVRATEIWFLALKSGTFDELSDGRGPLCVHPTNSFKFINQNNSASSCHSAGGRWLKFKQSDTAGNTNHTINFRFTGRQECNL